MVVLIFGRRPRYLHLQITTPPPTLTRSDAKSMARPLIIGGAVLCWCPRRPRELAGPLETRGANLHPVRQAKDLVLADVLVRAPRDIHSHRSGRPASNVDIAIIRRLAEMEHIHIHRSGRPDLWIWISSGARSSGFEPWEMRTPSNPRVTHTPIGKYSPPSKYVSSSEWRLMTSSTCFNVSWMPCPATDRKNAVC